MNDTDNLDLKTAYQTSKTVSLGDLELLKKSEKPYTIVCVKEYLNRPYILLGREDTPPEKRVWIVFNGEMRDKLDQYFSWMSEAQTIYEKKARSPEEMDYLRQTMLSIGFLSDLISDNEFTETTVQACLTKIAEKWYTADHPNQHMDSVTNEEFIPYLELVMKYVDRLAKFTSEIRECNNHQTES